MKPVAQNNEAPRLGETVIGEDELAPSVSVGRRNDYGSLVLDPVGVQDRDDGSDGGGTKK